MNYFVIVSILPHNTLVIVTSIYLLLVVNFHDNKLLTHGKRGESGGDELTKAVKSTENKALVQFHIFCRVMTHDRNQKA